MPSELLPLEIGLINPLPAGETVTFLPQAEAAASQGTATVLAQTFDQDIIGDLGNALNIFVQSGQIWALLIGFILGYVLRGVTTYK